LVRLVEYEVTSEPIDTPYPANRAFEAFLGPDRHNELHELIHDDPAAAIPELERVLAAYGPAPLLYNWLAAAYIRIGNHEKADEMQRLNYEKFPDYLFAKINHADTLLMEGKVEQAAKVVDHKFDLKLLFPHRSLFHVSEFVAMASLAIHYYLETGNMDSAERVFAVMQELAPDSPATESCGQQILLEQLSQGARNLLGRGSARRRRRRP
jgi:tetratricopeptide (TPR) repeat protein